MGFIKHALIGIALYEAVKYFLNKDNPGFVPVAEGPQAGATPRQQLRHEEVDVIAGARQTDQLKRMKENAATNWHPSHITGLMNTPQQGSQDSGDELKAGTDPETPLAGHEPADDQDDPWKKSLANDELRAPDS